MKAVVRTCACAISLHHLNLDFSLLCLAHIATRIRMNSLSVLFRDGSSSSYCSRKLFEFGAYANSLDHLDCSHCALAVFFVFGSHSKSKSGSCSNLELIQIFEEVVRIWRYI